MASSLTEREVTTEAAAVAATVAVAAAVAVTAVAAAAAAPLPPAFGPRSLHQAVGPLMTPNALLAAAAASFRTAALALSITPAGSLRRWQAVGRSGLAAPEAESLSLIHI